MTRLKKVAYHANAGYAKKKENPRKFQEMGACAG